MTSTTSIHRTDDDSEALHPLQSVRSESQMIASSSSMVFDVGPVENHDDSIEVTSKKEQNSNSNNSLVSSTFVPLSTDLFYKQL